MSFVIESEMNVTKMLQATKKLLGLLTRWSTGEVEEEEIYQEYDTLKSHFLQTIRVFERTLTIDDMIPLPDTLYECLKSTLASGPDALEIHLPRIKESILKLLASIKLKQTTLTKPNSNVDISSSAQNVLQNVTDTQESLVDKEIDIYIKKSDRVKKVSIKETIDIQELKRVFERHFGSIKKYCFYILDKVSNVEYELENMTDITPYSVISIHDDPMMEEMRRVLERTLEEGIKNWKGNDKHLREEIAHIRRTHEAYKEETQALLRSYRDSSRRGVEENQQITQAATAMITNRLEGLQDEVDQLKQDITQNRCRPSKSRMKYCQTESEWLSKELDEIQKRIKGHKPIWKKMWENELQQIVKEQQALKKQEGYLNDLREDYMSIMNVLKQATRISDIHERKKQLNGLEYFKAPEVSEGFDGMTSVLKEVSLINVDHDRRLKALEKAEKVRSRHLSHTIDAFERELTDFVCLRKLKNTGGPEKLDKQREIIDKTIMRQLFSFK